MSDAERPRLVGVQVVPFQHEGQSYLRIQSREGLSDHWLPLRRDSAAVLQYFDGQYTLEQVRSELHRECGFVVSHAALANLVQQLDSIYVLDTSRYHQRKRETVEAFQMEPIREPSHAGGAYQGEPGKLREQIRQIFEHPDGPGLPGSSVRAGKLRGILSPHIDFYRGGPSFAWGFKRLAEETDATLFVIIGTSHYSAERFILTRKDFKTPLGIARNNVAFVDHVASLYGPEVFADELAHKPEHSIEFQVLFLQYLFNDPRDFSFVPLLVGSFNDFVEYRADPGAAEDVSRMVEALRQAEQACGQKVCYISSGDLAHVGMKFGDPWMVDEGRSQWVRAADEALLQRLQSGRPASLNHFITAEHDRRRICGFPPTFTMLDAMRPQRGELLCYDQFVDPRGFEIVSFASMAFYGEGE